MLSQRMMKNYLMIGAGVKANKASKELAEAAERFEANLNTLAGYANSPAVRGGIKRVNAIWAKHKPKITAAPDKQLAAELLTENLQLLKTSHALVQEIDREASTHNADIVNVSGRQRMLSQRIAKTYTAIFWGINTSAMKEEFSQAQQEFEKAMSLLHASPVNTEAIELGLEKIDVYWKFAQPGLDISDGTHLVPGNIAITMESILKKMDEITHQYEDALNGSE